MLYLPYILGLLIVLVLKPESQLQIRGGIHIIFFLFLLKNIYCGYSSEAPRWGASNEYPQRMFSWRNKKDISIFRMKNAPYLLLCLTIKLYSLLMCLKTAGLRGKQCVPDQTLHLQHLIWVYIVQSIMFVQSLRVIMVFSETIKSLIGQALPIINCDFFPQFPT